MDGWMEKSFYGLLTTDQKDFDKSDIFGKHLINAVGALVIPGPLVGYHSPHSLEDKNRKSVL